MKKRAVMMAVMGVMGAWGAVAPEIRSCGVRAGDATVLDVTYFVRADAERVNVRALAFEDGERSFWKVVRPETFIDGTAANIGDGILANREHKLSWRVSSDWSTDLAKAKFEILVSEQGKIPLELITIPGRNGTPDVTCSYNTPTDEQILNAMYWYYANGETDIKNEDGYVRAVSDNVQLVARTRVDDRARCMEYIAKKMGYEPLVGELQNYARGATRQELRFNSSVANLAKPLAAGSCVYVGEEAYCAIDVSGGANATSYPVTYLDSAPSAGWGDEYKKTKILLRKIPAGSFMMYGNKPVTLTKPFYMGVFEITQKQYELVTGNNPSSYKGDMRPVERVSWNTIRGNSATYNWPDVKTADPNSFIGRIQARTGLEFDLPTEAQWEYACRAGTTSHYNNGNSNTSDLKMLGRYDGNQSDGKGGGYTQHVNVGAYMPNAWGLYDMHGNVWEWCKDWYAGSNTDPAEDPPGASSGSNRVGRGGGWGDYDVILCRSSYRYYYSPSDSHIGLGFRLSRTLVLP